MSKHKKTNLKTSLEQKIQPAIASLFYLLVLITPFFFTWFNEELFEFNKMMLVYGLAWTIIMAWIARMVAAQRIIFKRSTLDIPILIFVTSQVLSTLFSIHPRTSWLGYYTRFHGGLLSTFAYAGLYWAFVSNMSSNQTKTFLKMVLGGAIGSAVYAIPEHFGRSPSCLLITGSFDVQCWVQDVKTRVFGTFGQPNWLAAYAITLIPVSFAFLTTEVEKQTQKLNSGWPLLVLRTSIYWLSALLLFVTLLFTKSRSGFLGLAVGMTPLGIGYLLLAFYQKRWTLFASIAPITLAFVAALAVFGSPVTPSLFANFNTSPASAPATTPQPVANRLDIGGTESGEIRKIVWQGALEVWKRYPLLGSGVETFAYSYYRDRLASHNLVSEWDFLYNKAHNEFLNYLATTGLVGFTAYSVLLIWIEAFSLYHFWQNRTDSSGLKALACASGILALTVSNFFGFSTVMVTVLLFLLPAMIITLDQPALVQAQDKNQPQLSQPQQLSLGLIALICLFGWWQLYLTWQADHLFARGKQYLMAGYVADGLQDLQTAANISPSEALYFDELANTYAKIAVAYKEDNQATQSAELATSAIEASTVALSLNPVHLNFHKTRARIFLTLAQLDGTYLLEAKKTLESSLLLAPTDAKLWYNLGLVETSLGNADAAIGIFEKTIEMKPNYESARIALATEYEQKSQPEKALAQYEYIVQYITPNNEVVNQKLAALKEALQ